MTIQTARHTGNEEWLLHGDFGGLADGAAGAFKCCAVSGRPCCCFSRRSQPAEAGCSYLIRPIWPRIAENYLDPHRTADTQITLRDNS